MATNGTLSPNQQLIEHIKLNRLQYYSDPQYITSEHQNEIRCLLGVGDNGIFDFDNKKTKAIIAQLFTSKIAAMYGESLLTKLQGFNQQFDHNLEQGIKDGCIKRLNNRKNYSKRNQMSQLAEARNGLIYKLQLSDLHPQDFFVTNDKIQQGKKIDLLKYVKPDLRQKYWHDIAKHYIKDRPKTSHSHTYILNRLCDHYQDSILPLLQGSEGLHESSDGPQQQTSRIVRIPNLDNNDSTFGWLLSQHTPQEIMVKHHRYKDNYTRIQFYLTTGEVVRELQKQQEYYHKQADRFETALCQLNEISQKYQDGSYNKEDLARIITQIKHNSLHGKTIADEAIRKSNISDTNQWIAGKTIQFLKKKLQEQLYKIKKVTNKNLLHITSLEQYAI